MPSACLHTFTQWARTFERSLLWRGSSSFYYSHVCKFKIFGIDTEAHTPAVYLSMQVILQDGTFHCKKQRPNFTVSIHSCRLPLYFIPNSHSGSYISALSSSTLSPLNGIMPISLVWIMTASDYRLPCASSAEGIESR